MLGVSGMLGSSGDGPAAGEPHNLGAGPSSTGLSGRENMEFDDTERIFTGGKRWPRQETLALLKIRSDMDATFRDSSPRGPLWDEISRKMAELGYHRSAKKCREKFENVYKYHKRTKEGRSVKSEGKTYRFFDQLEALDQNQSSSQFPPPPPSPACAQNQGPESPTPVAMAMPSIIHHQIFPRVTVTSTPVAINLPHNMLRQSINTPITVPLQSQNHQSPAPATANATTGMNDNTVPTPNPCLNQCSIMDSDNLSEPSSSDGEDLEGWGKGKRKWESFFERLTKEMIKKQEEMQKRFLEMLERQERDRIAREEAWRAQEIARVNREHELFAQERSMAAAKDSAVLAYLHKVSDPQQQIQNAPQIQTEMKIQMQILAKENSNPDPVSQAPMPTHPRPPPPPGPLTQLQVAPPPPQAPLAYDNPKDGDGGENYLQASSSRWPKDEIQALIQIRTNMDAKYQENGPKLPLWEEISAEMKKIGYNRNAKRCKEKWENINKYFRKIKEGNKKRPGDSKTCPYFYLLDAIYREKAKSEGKPMAAPIMVQPEQQWPMAPETVVAVEDEESEEIEEEDDAGRYEIVTNKQASAVGAGGQE